MAKRIRVPLTRRGRTPTQAEAIAARVRTGPQATSPRPVLRGTPMPRVTTPRPVLRGSPRTTTASTNAGDVVAASVAAAAGRVDRGPRESITARASRNLGGDDAPRTPRTPRTPTAPAASPIRTVGRAASGGRTTRTTATPAAPRQDVTTPTPRTETPTRRVKPKKGTIAYSASKSAAQFDTFQKDTRTKALADFKATHAWTRDADEDQVKDTVAYLLSKEGGRYGSKRFSGPGTPSGGKPGTYSSPPPPSTATPTNPAADAVTAAATTPSGRRAMAPLEGAKLNAYRERYNIKPADYSSDGSLERLEVRDRQAASRRRRSKRTGGGGDTYEYNR